MSPFGALQLVVQPRCHHLVRNQLVVQLRCYHLEHFSKWSNWGVTIWCTSISGLTEVLPFGVLQLNSNRGVSIWCASTSGPTEVSPFGAQPASGPTEVSPFGAQPTSGPKEVSLFCHLDVIGLFLIFIAEYPINPLNISALWTYKNIQNKKYCALQK